MSAARARLGVLVSGSGSNLQALLDASAQADFPAEVVCAVSNVPTAFALERARKAGVAPVVLDHKAFASRSDFERALGEELRKARVEWVCLAGFMRLLSGDFLAGFPGRVLNIHPSLLPAFPGMHAQRGQPLLSRPLRHRGPPGLRRLSSPPVASASARVRFPSIVTLPVTASRTASG